MDWVRPIRQVISTVRPAIAAAIAIQFHHEALMKIHTVCDGEPDHRDHAQHIMADQRRFA